MDEQTLIAVIGLLCFALGFLVRGESARLKKSRKEAT
jgi:hypothetical protein